MMGFFISVPKTIEGVLVAVVMALLLTGCSYKFLGILQTSAFSCKRAFQWVRKKNNHLLGRHLVLFTLSALACAVIGLCFGFAGEWSAVVSMAAYLIFMGLYIWADNKRAVHIDVTMTPRLRGIIIILCLLYAIFCYIVVSLMNMADYVWGNLVFTCVRYVPLAIFALLIIPISFLANLISKIYDVPHGNKMVQHLKDDIETSGVTVVGISGSAGKTVVRNVLHSMLAKKYKVLSSSRAHYTPLGIARALNGISMADYEVYIVEMKARYAGDIQRICEVCPPDYSITTGICPEHIEGFGDREGMIEANAEILKATKKLSVIADSCYDDFDAYDCPKMRESCISGTECNLDGTTFTLTLGGESRRVHTRILSEFSAHNMALAAQLAFEMGVSLDEIVEVIDEMDYIDHRLKKETIDGVCVLDDMHASTLTEATAATELLGTYEGRKIVVTSGLTEPGVLETEENMEFGKQLAVADELVLIGDTLVKCVQAGYKAAGGDEEHVHIFATWERAKEYIEKEQHEGDTILYLDVDI